MAWHPVMIEHCGGEQRQKTIASPLGPAVPVWRCDCGIVRHGFRMAPHGCDGTPKTPSPKPTWAGLLCRHRGFPFGKVRDLDCGCLIDVRSCAVHTLCTLEPVNGALNEIRPHACVDCSDDDRGQV